MNLFNHRIHNLQKKGKRERERENSLDIWYGASHVRHLVGYYTLKSLLGIFTVRFEAKTILN